MIESDIRSCQRSLHKGGQANRVVFDAGKEQSIVMSTTDPSGGPAKVLGIDFDSKLVMRTAAHKCATKAAWKHCFWLEFGVLLSVRFVVAL